MQKISKHILVPLCFLWSSFVYGQGNDTGSVKADESGRLINNPPNVGKIKDPLPADGSGSFLLTPKETTLAFSILASLFFVLLIEVWIIGRAKIDGDNSIKLVIITLVLMGTLFIVMVGYDERILAPVFGLFGTIVGYLFGKSAGRSGT